MKTSRILAAGFALLASGTAGAQGLDRTKAPELGPPPTLSLPPIVTHELPNGLRLMIVEHHELPVADFVLVVRSGGTIDPPGRGGVANLTASMLVEGTTTRSSLDIADQAAFLGVSLGASATWDATTISLHTPISELDSALSLFADVSLNPAFPAEEFERIRTERLTALLQLKDRPPAIANQAYAAILYGSAHPYGRLLVGSEESVKALGTADLQAHYKANFVPNNATLIIVGDVTPADIEQRVRVLFGNWERGSVVQPVLTSPASASWRTIYLIDKPGAPQSSFRIGSIGVPRSTGDFFAITVMNTILGGSFTSRLNQNLREEKGYTYGAGSGFDMRRWAGPFTASAEVVGEKTDSALVEFMKELNAIRDTVPSAELVKAKRYLQLGLPSDFETTQQIARALVPVTLYDLPLDYYNEYVQNIERVTQADIQRVAMHYIDPSSISVVIVGDREKIEQGLKALDIGPVLVRDFFGQPVSQ